jgi:hypothetical protein
LTESDGLSTPKSNTIDTLEAEETRVGSTDVNKASIQSRLLKLIETKLSSLSLQVQDLKKHDANKKGIFLINVIQPIKSFYRTLCQ